MFYIKCKKKMKFTAKKYSSKGDQLHVLINKLYFITLSCTLKLFSYFVNYNLNLINIILTLDTIYLYRN